MNLDKSKIKVQKVGGLDLMDAFDFVDAYIEEAIYEPESRDLTEEELDWLNEDRDYVYESVLNYLQ